MVRYPFDTLSVLSNAEGLTMSGISYGYRTYLPFTLRYRRVNETFYTMMEEAERA